MCGQTTRDPYVDTHHRVCFSQKVRGNMSYHESNNAMGFGLLD